MREHGSKSIRSRILITGGAGQLGQRLAAHLADQFDVLTSSRTGFFGCRLDVRRADEVRSICSRVSPDWVIHCAALTNVDGCEANPEAAMAVNYAGAVNVAHAAMGVGARLIMMSTDFVFDGTGAPSTETTAKAPVNVYGQSKTKAEDALQELMPDVLIARTCVLWDSSSNNFITWVARALTAGNPVGLAVDQVVTPTSTHDVAQALEALVLHDESGIWHTAGANHVSRYGMGLAIAERIGANPELVLPVRMEDIRWTAPRPKQSTLNTEKIRRYSPPRQFNETLQDLRPGDYARAE